MQAKVVQLPTELARLRDSERLVQRWIEIQQTMEGADKASAVFEWRVEMVDHGRKFYPFGTIR